MTGSENVQAIEWAKKQPNPFAMQEVSEFARYEFDKPRPEGTWTERFKKWKAERQAKNSKKTR